MTEYTPSLSEMQGAYEFDRMCTTDTNRKGARAEFDRAIAKIKADALREVAAGFIDWDVIYGNEVATPEIEASHKVSAYLEREADRIEESAK